MPKDPFRPYVEYVTEHTRAQNGGAALGGNVQRRRRFDDSLDPSEYLEFALANMPGGISGYGRTVGLIIYHDVGQGDYYEKFGNFVRSVTGSGSECVNVYPTVLAIFPM